MAPLITRLGSLPLVAAVILVASGCDDSPTNGPGDELALGEWGGMDLGVIVGESVVHVHVACTFGDFPAPIALDPEGRFNVVGEYLLYAYPIAVDPAMPAVIAGEVRGDRMTFTVSVSDTINDQLVVLGPETVVRGREAEMIFCPICANPPVD